MDLLSNLHNSFRGLPGVGSKSAQRMVFHLLQHRQRGLQLAKCLEIAMANIKNCEICNNYTESTLCSICTDAARDNQTICIVENPSDIGAIEVTQAYKGRYFVLMGKLSPLDGIGPQNLPLEALEKQVLNNSVQEAILALSPTIEGQATMHYIQDLVVKISPNIKITQLARGVPFGGELEFLDPNTIGSALKNRACILD